MDIITDVLSNMTTLEFSRGEFLSLARLRRLLKLEVRLFMVAVRAELAKGLLRELNPGPLAPEARIIPLDQAASCRTMRCACIRPMNKYPSRCIVAL